MKLPVVHIMSIARSGETMLLRSLAQHPKLHIVHNLLEHDTPEALDLFYYLKESGERFVSHENKKVRAAGVAEGSIIVLKQGTWEHKFPFHGLVLIRNPLASFTSLKLYDYSAEKLFLESNWKSFCLPRLLRWSDDIDCTLRSKILGESIPARQFSIFFNRRFSGLKDNSLQLPVFRYEDICLNPDIILEKICGVIGVDYMPSMTDAHLAYDLGVKGHGKIDLSKPISKEGLNRYMNHLTSGEERILRDDLAWFFNLYNYNYEV